MKHRHDILLEVIERNYTVMPEYWRNKYGIFANDFIEYVDNNTIKWRLRSVKAEKLRMKFITMENKIAKDSESLLQAPRNCNYS
jgi:hypothetical protein